jgi:hypothetical protein
MPSEAISPQIRKGPPPVSAMAVSSQETVWFDGSELHGHIQPRALAGGG